MHMFRLQIQIQYVQIYINNIYGIAKKEAEWKREKKNSASASQKGIGETFFGKRFNQLNRQIGAGGRSVREHT